MSDLLYQKQYYEKILLLERAKQIKHALGFKFAHKFYNFQKEFIENSTDRIQLLCAANQLGKSSCQIIKALEWGFSSDEFRDKIFNNSDSIGFKKDDKLMFYYLYPDEDTALREFKFKWMKYLPKVDLLPDDMKDQFKWSVNNGYTKNIENLKKIDQLSLRNCEIFFLTYGKNVLNMQASTCHAVFTDEELPFVLFSELQVRLRATRGFFHMVFTSTLGEIEWTRAMEYIGKEEETFVNAWKKTISLRLCQKYSDGTPSMWTDKRILEEESKCISETERLIRVDGRCLLDNSTLILQYWSIDLLIDHFILPTDWELYCGIDIGSGGKNHKSGICITAVPPDRKNAVLLECWREDEIPTTEKDVLERYKQMISKYPRVPITFYDFHAKDFENLMLEDPDVTMYPAEKSHDFGFGLMNTLMKYKRLLFVNGSCVGKLIQEIKSLRSSVNKSKRKDDLVDSLRYSLTRIPFNLKDIEESVKVDINVNVKVEEKKDKGLQYRDGSYECDEEESLTDIEREFMEYNELVRGY